VLGIDLTVRAHLILPAGTLTTALLRPFASVTLGPNASGACTEVPPPPPANCVYVTYSNVTATTVLAIQTGTLVATLPASGGAEKAVVASPSFVLLAGAQAVKPRRLLIAQ
jgi:hypothetical protein